jgi:hypothetical protein
VEQGSQGFSFSYSASKTAISLISLSPCWISIFQLHLNSSKSDPPVSFSPTFCKSLIVLLPFVRNKSQLLKSVLLPEKLFSKFLSSVGFDETLLLDYLVSNETNFLTYFLKYLKYFAAREPSKSCQLEFADTEHCRKRRRRDYERNKSPISYANEEEEEGDDEELRKGFLCVLRLKEAINRLHRKELFPYNPKPLLLRLNQLPSSLELHTGTGQRKDCRDSSSSLK